MILLWSAPEMAAVSTQHSYQSNSAAPSKHVFSDDELSEIFQIDFGQIFGNPDSGRSSNYKGIKKTKQEGKKCVGQIWNEQVQETMDVHE